jgi:hypothetical protein
VVSSTEPHLYPCSGRPQGEVHNLVYFIFFEKKKSGSMKGKGFQVSFCYFMNFMLHASVRSVGRHSSMCTHTLDAWQEMGFPFYFRNSGTSEMPLLK